MDSLDILNGAADGLSDPEKQSALSFWALVNAPLIVGGDLTSVDSFAQQLLSNDEALAVDLTGKPAKQVLDGDLEVWVSDLGDGTYYVGLFNMNATVTNAYIPWSLLGFAHATAGSRSVGAVRSGAVSEGFSTVLQAHASQLLKISGVGMRPARAIHQL